MQDKIEQLMNVSVADEPVIDFNRFITFAINGTEDRDKVVRFLNNLSVQYSLDDTDLDDPNYFIFRLTDTRFLQ